MPELDFLVVGSGPAGQRAAIQAAKLGRRVALVDRAGWIGGVTVHTGTIPSKTLRETILYLTGWRQRSIYGPEYRLQQAITAGDLTRRLEITLRREVEVILDQLHRNGVEVLRGEASFMDPNRLRIVDDDGIAREVRAARILLATGTRPRRPDTIPFNGRTIFDTDEILRLGRIPRTIVVYGAGVIGVEYASMFAALGLKVTLVNDSERILPFVDREILAELLRSLGRNGFRLHLGRRLESVREQGDTVRVRFADGTGIETEMFLCAAGRAGCTEALHLENAGLTANERGLLVVNGHFQTAVPHIYAAGDVIGFPSLASTSMEQGRLAARHACGQPHNAAPTFFPYGIYSVPEISMIGKTGQELDREGVAYEAGIARLRESARGQILGYEEGLLKLLVARDDHRLLGVHIVGEGATELIHVGQAIMALGGTLEYFVDNVFNYPTLAEVYKIAALDAWNRLS